MNGDSQVNSWYTRAASAVAASAALHLIGAVISGFTGEGLILLPVVVLYVVFAALLQRGLRWLGYFVFLCMWIGAIGSWIASGSAIAVPVWVYIAISVCDVLAAISLFVVLWRNPAQA
ncbi:MAG: hypothetical protein AAGJ86_09175 [Pseudomonadota bacterium]